jgi:hypothetical protein
LLYGYEKINKDIKTPIQKEEHSIHNNILRRNVGKYLATKFLNGIKISEVDQR